MTTAHFDEPAQRVAEQLAAVVIAALRPDTAPLETGPDPDVMGAAVQRIGGELLALMRQLEPDPELSADSSIARAAHLAAQITLSGKPHFAWPD
ncbi:hypothetical protein FHU38_002761 [Saccharomonospora amisosensis]|uniref:Uncharacterized protein n=1 Tax=Saccharomonospora amisosensis TaxID=1128677 RepID=A0A7X5ZR35_9PSEU|nr:hypothetical protein [Saccharomonospora amisosensis]NIJ12417.1 hypothetical protein [Saccharomonospora amisosensis]